MKYRVLNLSKGLVTIIDEDRSDLLGYKWFTFERRGQPFAVRWDNSPPAKTKVWLHRSVIEVPEGWIAAHKNGQTLDNRACNIEIRSPFERRISKYPNIIWNGRIGKWIVLVDFEDQKRCIGQFEREKDAIKAFEKTLINTRVGENKAELDPNRLKKQQNNEE